MSAELLEIAQPLQSGCLWYALVFFGLAILAGIVGLQNVAIVSLLL